MVPDATHIEAVLSGEKGLLEGMQKEKDPHCHRAVEPLYIQQLQSDAARRSPGDRLPGCRFMKGAIDGTLTIMAGGPEEVLEACGSAGNHGRPHHSLR